MIHEFTELGTHSGTYSKVLDSDQGKQQFSFHRDLRTLIDNKSCTGNFRSPSDTENANSPNRNLLVKEICKSKLNFIKHSVSFSNEDNESQENPLRRKNALLKNHVSKNNILRDSKQSKPRIILSGRKKMRKSDIGSFPLKHKKRRRSEIIKLGLNFKLKRLSKVFLEDQVAVADSSRKKKRCLLKKSAPQCNCCKGFLEIFDYSEQNHNSNEFLSFSSDENHSNYELLVKIEKKKKKYSPPFDDSTQLPINDPERNSLRNRHIREILNGMCCLQQLKGKKQLLYLTNSFIQFLGNQLNCLFHRYVWKQEISHLDCNCFVCVETYKLQHLLSNKKALMSAWIKKYYLLLNNGLTSQFSDWVTGFTARIHRTKDGQVCRTKRGTENEEKAGIGRSDVTNCLSGRNSVSHSECCSSALSDCIDSVNDGDISKSNSGLMDCRNGRMKSEEEGVAGFNLRNKSGVAYFLEQTQPVFNESEDKDMDTVVLFRQLERAYFRKHFKLPFATKSLTHYTTS